MSHEEYLEGKRRRAAQLRVSPRGRGFVELAFVNGCGDVLVSADGGEARLMLQYPVSGTLIGDDARDIVNARHLQEAAAALNSMLFELAS